MKFLLIISMPQKTEWSWELGTWSGKKSVTDISKNPPHYVCWKSIGTVNENPNFDIRVQRVKLFVVRSNGGYHVFLAVLEGDWELLAYAVTWQLTTFLRFEITTPYIQQMSKNYLTGERYVPLRRITGKKSLNVVFNKHDRNVEFN